MRMVRCGCSDADTDRSVRNLRITGSRCFRAYSYILPPNGQTFGYGCTASWWHFPEPELRTPPSVPPALPASHAVLLRLCEASHALFCAARFPDRRWIPAAFLLLRNEIRIICKIIQRLDRCQLVVSDFTTIQQLIESCRSVPYAVRRSSHFLLPVSRQILLSCFCLLLFYYFSVSVQGEPTLFIILLILKILSFHT